MDDTLEVYDGEQPGSNGSTRDEHKGDSTQKRGRVLDGRRGQIGWQGICQRHIDKNERLELPTAGFVGISANDTVC